MCHICVVVRSACFKQKIVKLAQPPPPFVHCHQCLLMLIFLQAQHSEPFDNSPLVCKEQSFINFYSYQDSHILLLTFSPVVLEKKKSLKVTGQNHKQVLSTVLHAKKNRFALWTWILWQSRGGVHLPPYVAQLSPCPHAFSGPLWASPPGYFSHVGV